MSASSVRLDSIERALADIADGKAVVVVDDEDRENEGDIIFAASKATPELMAFTIRHSSGVICVPMPAAMLDRLEIPLMTPLLCRIVNAISSGVALLAAKMMSPSFSRVSSSTTTTALPSAMSATARSMLSSLMLVMRVPLGAVVELVETAGVVPRAWR